MLGFRGVEIGNMGRCVRIVERAVASREMVLGRMVSSWKICVETVARDVGRRRD